MNHLTRLLFYKNKKNNKKIETVICCSYDWHFKDLLGCCTVPYRNSKGLYQPVHLRSLFIYGFNIYTFYWFTPKQKIENKLLL